MTFGLSLFIAVLAGFIAFLYNVYLAYVKERIAYINECIQSVDRIEKLAVEYWLSPGNASHEGELIAAAELRGALAVTATFNLELRRICGERFSEYRKLDGALFDAATGAAFETADRKPDPSQTVLVMASCHELRAFLRSERPRAYWAR